MLVKKTQVENQCIKCNGSTKRKPQYLIKSVGWVCLKCNNVYYAK